MDNFEDLDDKTRKKMTKVVKNAAYAIGGGLGLIALKFLFGNVGSDEKVRALFDGLGFWLVIYGFTVIGFAVFKRRLLFRVNTILVYLVTPIVIVKLFMAFV